MDISQPQPPRPEGSDERAINRLVLGSSSIKKQGALGKGVVIHSRRGRLELKLWNRGRVSTLRSGSKAQVASNNHQIDRSSRGAMDRWSDPLLKVIQKWVDRSVGCDSMDCWVILLKVEGSREPVDVVRTCRGPQARLARACII